MPLPERQAELEVAYERQKDTDVPYKDVKIRTLGELQWIMQQLQWSGKDKLQAGMQRVNLSGADLNCANPNGALHEYPNLSRATLREANLSGALLTGANLNGASLIGVKFDSDTVLASIALSPTSKLQGIRWNGADLTGVIWEPLQIVVEETDAQKPRYEEDGVLGEYKKGDIKSHDPHFASQIGVFRISISCMLDTNWL